MAKIQKIFAEAWLQFVVSCCLTPVPTPLFGKHADPTGLCGLHGLWCSILFSGPDQGELAYPGSHMVLETMSWYQGSELSGAKMIPQMTVVADLTGSEDLLSLKPGYAVARAVVHKSQTSGRGRAGGAPNAKACQPQTPSSAPRGITCAHTACAPRSVLEQTTGKTSFLGSLVT